MLQTARLGAPSPAPIVASDMTVLCSMFELSDLQGRILCTLLDMPVIGTADLSEQMGTSDNVIRASVQKLRLRLIPFKLSVRSRYRLGYSVPLEDHTAILAMIKEYRIKKTRRPR